MGAPRKRVPKCLKGPKTTYTTMQLLKNSPREVKRAHFRYVLGPPWSRPGNGIYAARRGRSLPVPPPRFLRPWLWVLGSPLAGTGGGGDAYQWSNQDVISEGSELWDRAPPNPERAPKTQSGPYKARAGPFKAREGPPRPERAPLRPERAPAKPERAPRKAERAPQKARAGPSRYFGGLADPFDPPGCATTDANPLWFSENNSRTDRPIVTKLDIPNR